MTTQREAQHMKRVAAIGCIVCKSIGHPDSPAEIHHIREGQGMSERASNFLVIPLCPAHHRTGGKGVALHAGIETFESMYGSELDLLAEVIEELSM